MSVHDMDGARVGSERSEVSAFADGETAVTVLASRTARSAVIDNARSAGYGFECTAEVMGTDSTLRIGTTSRARDIERLTEDGLTRAAAGRSHRAPPRGLPRGDGEFARCLEDGEPPAVGGEDAVAALALALAAERSVRRLALITGATSGIGLACARTFAAAGWGVALVGRSEDGLAAAAADLRGRAVAVCGDVALPAPTSAPSPLPSSASAASTQWWETPA